MYFLK